MAQGVETAAPAPAWWSTLPAHRVAHLTGVDPDLLAIALDPLPAGAPAVLRFRPSATGPLGDQVAVLLAELDRVAVALFPAWLPGADRLAGPQGRGVAAVRALAADLAARAADFGPFLADLAERSLRRRPGGGSRFPAEVRAAGVVRAIARAYDRPTAALLIDVPDGLSTEDERALVAAAEWLADHGRLSVWLAGAPLGTVDRVSAVTITLPARLIQLAADAAATAADPRPDPVPDEPVLGYPPLSGLPHSDTEWLLERALERHEWATGRRWNHRHESTLLSEVYRLDVYWPAEGVVVEVDGPEHRRPVLFANDRRRDNALTIDGLHVLRFGNERVHTDLGRVLFDIETLLHQRRTTEKRHHDQ
ncbi:hypothetical protein GCM10009682_36480 [Luedemannella flava]|uniref:DUF559 domain-containing protein n=1 Tax=Luedemannella flava TaxID=349316 RepID=A0ABP4YDQ1_9ACTN